MALTSKGFGVCLRSEMWIAVRSSATYLAVLLPSAIVTIYLAMSRVTEAAMEAREQFTNVDIGIGGDYASGYGHFVDGMLVSLTAIVLIVTTYAAWSFANDCRTGTVRNMVTRVASRHSVIFAKVISVHVMAFLSFGLALTIAYLLAGSLWAYESVVEDGYELIGEMEIRNEILLGMGLASVTIPASIALGTFVSASASSPVQSTVIVLALLVIYGFFQPYFGSYAEYCFLTFTPLLFDASYLREVSDIVKGYSDVYVSDSTIRLNLWIPIAQAIGLLVLTYFVIDRRRL